MNIAEYLDGLVIVYLRKGDSTLKDQIKNKKNIG